MRNVGFLLSNSPLNFLVLNCTGRPTNRADIICLFGVKRFGVDHSEVWRYTYLLIKMERWKLLLRLTFCIIQPVSSKLCVIWYSWTQVSYVITFPYQFILQDACRGPKLPTAWKTTMNISERANFILKHVEGYLQNNHFNTDKSCEVIL